MVEMKRAVELDPLAPRILDNYGGYLTWLGKYPEALEIFDQVYLVDQKRDDPEQFRAIGWCLGR